MVTLDHYQIPEIVEDAIQAIVPTYSVDAGDLFVAVDPGQYSRDRDFSVLEESPPSRKTGTGGCTIAIQTLTVSIFYGTGRESRRRRLTDAWQILAALEDVRRDQPAIERVVITPAPTQLDDTSQFVLMSWSVTVTYYTQEAA